MHKYHEWWTIGDFLLLIFDIKMKTVEIMYSPLVLLVLKWSGEEKLGSVRPSRFFCTSVTVYNIVYFNKKD